MEDESEGVVGAQRAYGRYLNAEDAEAREAALAEAREGYRSVLAMANEGNQAARTEIARLFAEPGTIKKLGLGVTEMFCSLEAPARIEAYRLFTWSTAERIRLLNALDGKDDFTRTVESDLLDQARSDEDVQTLSYLVENAEPEIADTADAEIGRNIASDIESLRVTALHNPAEWLDLAALVSTMADRWLTSRERADDDPTAEAVRDGIVDLQSFRHEVEGRALENLYRNLYGQPPWDLRSWMASIEHLSRRTRLWSAEEDARGGLPATRQFLEGEAERSSVHARSWATDAIVQFGTPRAPNRSMGGALAWPACPQCAAMTRPGAKFCPQCGSPGVLAPKPTTEIPPPPSGPRPDLPAVRTSAPTDAGAATATGKSSGGEPADSPTPTTAPQALVASELFAVGDKVAFAGSGRVARRIWVEPRPDAPLLDSKIPVGRVTVLETRGGWVRIRHSQKIQGWVGAGQLRPLRRG